MKTKPRIFHVALLAVLVALALVGPAPVQAQDEPPERVLRTYIPPDQLVSFLPSTPFDKFVEFVNPIFERVTGKQIIDPEEREGSIGITITSMHFLDAFELVLERNSLEYRETEGFFIVQEPSPLAVGATASTAGTGVGAETNLQLRNAATIPGQRIDRGPAAGITLDSREIQINAILFEVNQSKARELGIDWNVFFGEDTGGGGNTGLDPTKPRFFLETGELFESVDGIINAPQAIDMSKVTQFFRLLENEGLGETVANPQINVLSGEKGRIQIGSDIPVQVRDFAGNTVTQFFSTGIIVDVTPTLFSEAVSDSIGSPILDFIHLDVLAEKSSGRPSAAGLIIDRNTANTQVVLLDGEQTIIGGLYSTDEAVQRRGIPVLKDMPLLRYVFGYNSTTTAQKELLIVLQAQVIDPLEARSQRPFEQQLLDKRRRQIERSIREFSEPLLEEVTVPEPAGQPD